MSDTDNKPAADEVEVYADPEAVEVEATLKHGETYYLGNRRFDRGVPQPITNAERELLDDPEHGSDVLSFDGPEGVESQSRAKFTFAPVGTGVKPTKEAAPRAAAEAPAPRRRGPAQA